MSIYRFSDDSPIVSITFHYVNGKPSVGLIETSATAKSEHIAAASKALSGMGMSLIPVTVDERDMLQVSGFGDEQALIDALGEQKAVKGAPEITKEKSDVPPPPKSKFKIFLEKYSFRLAGALNLIGDVSMHFKGYGEITKKTRIDKETGNKIDLTPDERDASVTSGKYDLVGGGLYTVGGLNAAAFGNSKSKAAPLADRLNDFIAHTADSQAHPTKPTKESESFLRRHAADVTLASYMAGAAVLLKKGVWGYQKLGEQLKTLSADPAISADSQEVKDLKLKQKKSASLMRYGAWSFVCKALSLFVKEKPKSEEDKPKSHNPVMRVIGWFREKPLRIFGLGSLISETLYAHHAYDTYKEAKKPGSKEWDKSETISAVVTTAAYYLSDLLSAVSSKNPLSKPLDKDGERGVIARAAQSIAEQSPEKRDELVSKTAQFLSDQSEIKSGKKSITDSLKTHLKHLESNPWANRVADEAVPQAQR